MLQDKYIVCDMVFTESALHWEPLAGLRLGNVPDYIVTWSTDIQSLSTLDAALPSPSRVMQVLRFLKTRWPREKTLAPGNLTDQAADIGGSKGSRNAPQDRRSEGDNATLQGNGPAEGQNEQLGHNTPDLRSAQRDPETVRESSRDAHDLFQSGVKERGLVNRTLARLAVAINVAKRPAEAFGPLKAVLESISIIYDQYQSSVAVKDKIETLCSRIVTLVELFEKPASDEKETKLREGLLIKLKVIEEKLRPLRRKPAAMRFFDNVQDAEDVTRLLEHLQETVNNYVMVHQMAIYEQGCKLMNEAEKSAINNFRCANGAEYRHGERSGCLEGTRGAVLNSIELWARNFNNSSPIYWLNGLAGTGKSTIAKTIAERLFAGGQLGASFFCSRDFEDRSNLTLIFPTLAVQLARKYTEFRSIFVPLIQLDPGIAYESLYNQMDKLIVRPLNESSISTVIVIDALDECEDEEPASAILSVLGRLISKIPKVKFFLTGRPEQHIREGFRLLLSVKVFALHKVEPCQVDSDIRLFFRHSFLEVVGRRKLNNWPTEEQLDRLCERAAGLFVYASATVKFIDSNKRNPETRLDLLLQSQKIGVHEGKSLDELYMSILQEAFHDDDSQNTRSVFAAVILAVNPLSPSTIAALLGLKTEDVLPLLSSINSLLIFQGDVNHPVRPFHKSFPDFVTDPKRCTNHRFYISPPDHHSQLLIGCLDLMRRTLRKNMCNLPDDVVNSQVSNLQERTELYIAPPLQYACRSWHMHLAEVNGTMPVTTPAISALHQFLEEKFLFWLEVLSVLGAVRNAVEALRVAADWLRESPTLDLVNDCSNFVSGNFEVITTSSLHIYRSALVSTPKNSIIRKLYESFAPPFLRVVHGLPMSWDQNTTAISCPSVIEQVVFSPCSKFIATTLVNTTTVDVLDPVTLQRLQILEFPQGISTLCRALTFSPDSRMLTCSNLHRSGRELFVVSWDLQTGVVASVIRWDASLFYKLEGTPSITYSADGQMVGVSYWDSPYIFICNVASGVYAGYHIISHTGDIWAHGKSFRFATGGTTVTIWDVGFIPGAEATVVETLHILDFPELSPSLHFEEAMLLLPDLCRLAVAFDGSVLVLDGRNPKPLLHCMDAHFLPDMSFSSDGRFFACSTLRSEIYLWKESPTGYVLHGKLINWSRPLLSPNGESIVASNGRMMQLWPTNGFTTPTSKDFVLEFSLDGTLAAVAVRKEEIVTVTDLKFGLPRLTVDTGLEVYGLGFRSGGNTIAVIGNERVAFWKLPADCAPGYKVGPKDTAHTVKLDYVTPVTAASISYNFHYITFMREGEGLRFFSAFTGKLLGGEGAEGIQGLLQYGHHLRCAYDSGETKLLKVLVWGKGPEMRAIRAKRLTANDEPPKGCPWEPSDYRVTNDWWIVGPDGKRLFMLPSAWRSEEADCVLWAKSFLALIHSGLSEPVILDLNP